MFDYSGLSTETIAKLTAKELERLRVLDGKLGVSIIPKGFTVTDNVWQCRVKFREGKLEKPAVFHLRADDKPAEAAGVHVFFDVQGSVLYEFDIPLRVVESIAEFADPLPAPAPLELDLDVVFGHTHQPDQVRFSAGGLYVNPGSWTRYVDLDHANTLTLDDLRREDKFPYQLNYVRVEESSTGELKAEMHCHQEQKGSY